MRTWLVLLLGGITLALHTHAQTKALDPTQDPRLQQTLSLRFAGVPLYRALLHITQQTGVVLRAEDAIKEHRVVLYAPNQPLHLVLEHIAQAFDYEWKRIENEKDAPVYRLVDPKPVPQTAPDWRWLREQLLARVCQEFQKPVGQRLEKIKEIFEMDEDELLNSPQFPEYLATKYAVGTFTLPIYRALCGLGESDWKRLQRGEMLFLNTRNGTLPTEVLNEWKALEEYFAQQGYISAFYGFTEDPEHEKKLIELHLSKASSVDEVRVALWYDPEAKRLVGTAVWRDKNGRPMFRFSAFIGDHRLGIIGFHDSQSKYGETEASFPKHGGYQKTLERYRPPDVLGDWFSWLAELMVQMAHASDICLVAEYYPLYPTPYEMGIGYEYTLDSPIGWSMFYEMLHKGGYRAQLSEQGWLVLRHRRWVPSEEGKIYVRHFDIPQATLERWFYKPNHRGMVTLEEHAEIARLPADLLRKLCGFARGYLYYIYGFSYEDYLPNEEQERLHGGLLYARWVDFGLYYHLRSVTDYPAFQPYNRDEPIYVELIYALRLYGQLSPAQRALLKGGGTLPFLALSLAQQQLFLLAISNGYYLTLNELQLPPDQLHQVMQNASMRLIADTEETSTIRILNPEVKDIKTLQEWKEWLRSRPPIQEAEVKRRIRSWRFEFRWGDALYECRTLTGYPPEREPK